MYSSIEDVILYTGVKSTDFGDEFDEVQLEDMLNSLLEEITDIINEEVNKNFEEIGQVPKGINLIAKRMAGNALSMMKLRRSTSVVSVNEYKSVFVKDELLTDEIRKDLYKYRKKQSISLTFAGGYQNVEE